MTSLLKRGFLPVLLFFTTFFIFGLDTVSVVDLTVNSSNPQYEYIGKGLGELISFELGKSKDVVLVDREQRSELMEEMKLSYTGLTDESTQLEIGKLLSVKYLVTGDIIDMASMLLISIQMVDVESGAIVLNEKISEALGNYAYISGYFAKAILNYLGAGVSASTAAAVETKEEKNPEAAIAISNAIDSYDKKDTKAAKKSLVKAKELDPENQVVDLYLQKLSPTSPKYKVQLEGYGNSQNPALLGVIRQDRGYFYQSMPTVMSSDEMKSVGDSFSIGEQYMAIRTGLEFPLGERLGLSAELAFSSLDSKIETPFSFDIFDLTGTTYFHDLERGYGGTISTGYLINDLLSVGASVHVYWNRILDSDDSAWDEGLELAGDIGFLVRNRDNSLIFDSHTVFPTQDQYYLDVDTQEAGPDLMPIITETTLTSALMDRRLFLSLKANSDVFADKRKGVVVRAIPVAEYWPVRFLSLRGGYQFTYLNIDDSADSGHGFIAGATLRLGKIDLDVNFTSRYQPARVLPGYGKRENFLLIGISRSGNFSRLSR